jgi:SAM-dependent methyltransferase
LSDSGIFGRLYDPVMEVPENVGLRRLRQKALDGLRGRVLELGIGTGRNLPLYPDGITHLAGVDPDEAMLGRARERASQAPSPVDLVPASAEELPFEDAGFDAAVATLAFCTIPDAPRALREARRVLKEGAEFRLLEHVRMERERVAWLQEKATPLWKRAAGGCHLDRDTLAAVRGAGFEVGRVERRLGGLLLTIFARNPPPWPAIGPSSASGRRISPPMPARASARRRRSCSTASEQHPAMTPAGCGRSAWARGAGAVMGRSS